MPRRLTTFVDSGIILRAYKLGESDRILRILTRAHGKRSAVAKGVRKTLSRFGARLEPLSCSKMLIYSGKSLDIIKQAEIQESFHELRENIELFVNGEIMAELAESLTQEHEPFPELFDLMLDSLRLMRDLPAHHELAVVFFDLHALSISGIGLTTNCCTVCGETPSSRSVLFSPKLGGAVCERCWKRISESGGAIRVSGEAGALLRHLSGGSLDWRLAGSFGRSAVREVRLLMDRMVEYLTEREFRSRRIARHLALDLKGQEAARNTGTGSGERV